MAENEKTSEKIGKIASKIVKSPNATEDEKSVTGSALTQRPGITDNEKTSAEVCAKASKLLKDPHSSKEVKQVATSILAQCPDK